MGNLPNVAPGSSQDILVATLNQVIDLINAEQRTKVLNDGLTNRYLQGFQKGGWPGGDFGMKISPAGVDVVTAKSEDLLFSWDFTKGTMYWNFNGVNYRQDGILPDGTGGSVIAKPGINVSSIYQP